MRVSISRQCKYEQRERGGVCLKRRTMMIHGEKVSWFFFSEKFRDSVSLRRPSTPGRYPSVTPWSPFSSQTQFSFGWVSILLPDRTVPFSSQTEQFHSPPRSSSFGDFPPPSGSPPPPSGYPPSAPTTTIAGTFTRVLRNFFKVLYIVWEYEVTESLTYWSCFGEFGRLVSSPAVGESERLEGAVAQPAVLSSLEEHQERVEQQQDASVVSPGDGGSSSGEERVGNEITTGRDEEDCSRPHSSGILEDTSEDPARVWATTVDKSRPKLEASIFRTKESLVVACAANTGIGGKKSPPSSLPVLHAPELLLPRIFSSCCTAVLVRGFFVHQLFLKTREDTQYVSQFVPVFTTREDSRLDRCLHRGQSPPSS